MPSTKLDEKNDEKNDERKPKQTPSIGRMVQYVIRDGQSAGVSRPAVIVSEEDRKTHSINLRVFTDGANDHPYDDLSWVGEVLEDPDCAPGTWHWPVYVPPKAD